MDNTLGIQVQQIEYVSLSEPYSRQEAAINKQTIRCMRAECVKSIDGRSESPKPGTHALNLDCTYSVGCRARLRTDPVAMSQYLPGGPFPFPHSRDSRPIGVSAQVTIATLGD